MTALSHTLSRPSVCLSVTDRRWFWTIQVAQVVRTPDQCSDSCGLGLSVPVCLPDCMSVCQTGILCIQTDRQTGRQTYTGRPRTDKFCCLSSKKYPESRDGRATSYTLYMPPTDTKELRAQGFNWWALQDRRKDARLCMLYRVDRRLVAIKTDRRLISPKTKTRNIF